MVLSPERRLDIESWNPLSISKGKMSILMKVLFNWRFFGLKVSKLEVDERNLRLTSFSQPRQQKLHRYMEIVLSQECPFKQVRPSELFHLSLEDTSAIQRNIYQGIIASIWLVRESDLNICFLRDFKQTLDRKRSSLLCFVEATFR